MTMQKHISQHIEPNEIIDRCCCECGDHFDGTAEDDYCNSCWESLYP